MFSEDRTSAATDLAMKLASFKSSEDKVLKCLHQLHYVNGQEALVEAIDVLIKRADKLETATDHYECTVKREECDV